MRFLITFCLIVLFSSSSFSQITTQTEREKDGSISIYTTNEDIVPYTVILNFTSLRNLSTPGGKILVGTARSGKNKITTLKVIRNDATTDLAYKITFAKGEFNARSKNEAVYLFPVTAGKKITALKMTHIENRLLPDQKNNDFVGLSFRLEGEAEVVAPRKGIISDVSMGNQTESQNLDFSRSENFIEIYHEDGTLTKISVLKSGSQMVKKGDIVIPGQVIAMSGGENYNSGSHVRMVNLKLKKDGLDKLTYDAFPVKFAAENEPIEIDQMVELSVVHPEEVILSEMSKRELKKYFGN